MEVVWLRLDEAVAIIEQNEIVERQDRDRTAADRAAGAPGVDGRLPTAGNVELPLVAEDFLSWMAAERGRSANTLVVYRRDLLGYSAWLCSSCRRLRPFRPRSWRRSSANAAATACWPASPASWPRCGCCIGSVRTSVTGPTTRPRDRWGAGAVGHSEPLTEDEVVGLLAAVTGVDPLVGTRPRDARGALRDGGAHLRGLWVVALRHRSRLRGAARSARVRRSASSRWSCSGVGAGRLAGPRRPIDDRARAMALDAATPMPCSSTRTVDG